MNRNAALYALASAALFGASTPAVKLLLDAIDPFVLAGMLYIGAGIGIFAVRWLKPWFASNSSARWHSVQLIFPGSELPSRLAAWQVPYCYCGAFHELRPRLLRSS
jgi:drug/metabolite transporter (DMT)-like permease